MGRYSSISFVVVGLMALVSGCTGSSDTLFEPVDPEKSGVAFSNDLTDTEMFNIVDYLYFYNGGGVSVADINNDGLTDIYFTANQKPNKLYLNKGDFKFEDITDKAGVAAPGDWKTGVTMVDINADGYQDIYVCQLGDYKGLQGKNQLFINNGDLTFTEKAAEYGLDFKGFSTHAAFFDYDNDGDLDTYLLNHSVHTERTYGKAELRNQKDALAGDRLLRNDAGKFTDVTDEAGIYSSHIGYGLAVGLSDVNMDGWADIYISNDFHENDYLYINNQDGTFSESISTRIDHTSRSSMGNDLADINNDGWPEILSLDMLPEDEYVLKMSAGEDAYDIYRLKLSFGFEKQFARNTLQLNLGSGKFSEIGIMAGVHATDWSWAPLFADFDNDGFKDLFISNGIVKRPNDMDYIAFIASDEIKNQIKENPDFSDSILIAQMPRGQVPNYFFRNNGDLTFADKTGSWGPADSTFSNGAAYADFDNDGDLDLVVNNINATATILRNKTIHPEQETNPNWLKFDFEGPEHNPDGIGARVNIYADSLHQVYEMFTSRGYQSSVEPFLTVGLGTIDKVDSVRISWPGGKSELITAIAANQKVAVKYTNANDEMVSRPQAKTPLLRRTVDNKGISFSHFENQFIDYNREYMVPHLLSREGPKIDLTDVNGDGLQDLYIGGASRNNGMLFMQKEDGTFEKSSEVTFREEPAYEELGVSFFDANGDQYPDLYVVSSGNEYLYPHPMLNDRLFLNDGKGNFTLSSDSLPELFQHGSVAAPADFDRDGDMDVFVGAQIEGGKYGLIPESYLLVNNGAGIFEEQTDTLSQGLKKVGMVRDATWQDLNSDGWPDLIVLGEWMPIKIFMNREGRLEETPAKGLEQSHGWWNTIEAADIDNDGDIDFIAGNLGYNSKLQASPQEPVKMYVNDFDYNLTIDQIISYTENGKEYPLNTKDEIVKQMPILKKNFVRYKDYAGKTIQEIFSEKGIEGSNRFAAFEFATAIIENKGDNTFEIKPLPYFAQMAPIMAIEVYDVNGDGHLDLLMGGNREGVSPYFGTYDANKSILLLGDGKGNFKETWPGESGLLIDGEIRDIKVVETVSGPIFIFARNNNSPVVYERTD